MTTDSTFDTVVLSVMRKADDEFSEPDVETGHDTSEADVKWISY
jgi:hypothetical protein